MAESVVDYQAWRKGYMPPSEHILIDQLSHRGARVILGSDWGDLAMWVVVRGSTPSREVRKKMREMIELAFDSFDAAREEAPPETKPKST